MLHSLWSRNVTLLWQPDSPPTTTPTTRGLLLPPPRGSAAGSEASSGATASGGTPVAQAVASGSLLSLLVVWTLLGNVLVCVAIVGSRHLRAKLNWHKGGEAHTTTTATPLATGSTMGIGVTPWVGGLSTAWTAGLRQGGNATLATQRCDASLNRTYAISSSLISFYIPVAIMIVTYTRIYRIAQVQIRRISSLERAAEHAQSCRSSKHLDCTSHHHHHHHHHPSLKSSIRKETKVLKTLSVIMGVFVCCWLPFFVLNCMVPFCESAPDDPDAGLPCVSDTTFNVFVWFGWANSSLNPIIYAFNADFRKVFSNLLGCSQHCSSTPVETVNISNELISYNQDTFFHREIATAYVNMIPHVVRGGSEEDPFDHMSQISPDHEVATDSVCELDCEGDISLDKITPFTSSYLL
ncbi:hypothetical protein lerEdw1_019130 [Lerista edwardsae]|nr:hypothetical protein lerEdw1_019130 [Lerista edwardsae]